MRVRVWSAFVAVVALGIVPMSAQRTVAPNRDLQGYWTNSTATPLQRPAEFKDRFTLTEAEAAAFEKGGLDRIIKGLQPEDQIGADLNDIYAETNTMRLFDRRTSLIVDPPDGRLPPQLPQAQQRADSRKRSYDNPETFTLEERCLASVAGGGSQMGAPIVPHFFGLNYYQIVQTHDLVMIATEMIHDFRIVRIGGTHPPSSVRQWFGHSIGHWEDDTLVVDTTNFNGKFHFRNSGEQLHVVERFTRTGRTAIRYRATVEDPETWTRPWTIDYAFRASDVPILEYACHEGNYSLANALRGQRVQEKEKEKGKQ